MEYNVPQKGLNLDISSTQEGTYPFAYNAQIQSFTDESSFPYLSNTPSNELCFTLSSNETIIGVLPIYELNTTLYFVKSTVSKILAVKECNVKVLIDSTCLNFSERIKSVYKLTDETLNLYFVDGVNQDRYIKFDRLTLDLLPEFKLNYTEGCNITYNDELDCDKTKFYPSLEYPCLELSTIDGGSKKAGVYEYYIAYTTSKGDELTSWISATSPIHLFDLNKSYQVTDYNTNQAIQVTINNLNGSRYRFFSIVAVETINEQTSYLLKGTFPITGSTYTWVDTDNQGGIFSSSQLFQKYPYYKSSKLITKANNILLKGKVKEFEKFNLQKAVNNIELEWTTIKLKLGDYKNPEIANKYRGFLRDEVYTFGIKFILDNLEETPVFLLSNRTATTYDKEVINNADGFGKRWEVYNTASVLTTPNEQYSDSGCPAVYQTGKFAYWESTETYPTNSVVWGDLCGKPIRHFKFPDNSISSHFDNSYIYPLGVQISSDIPALLNQAVLNGEITQEQRNRIKGWKLLRGNRANNKSVIAKGILYDMWSYEKPTSTEEDSCNNSVKTKYYYANYPYNDLRPDKLLSSTKDHYKYSNFELGIQTTTPQTFKNENKYTFHSPDTSFVNPNIGNQLKLEGEIYGTSKGWFVNSEQEAKQKLLTKRHYELAFLYAKFIADTTSDGSAESASQLGSSIGQNIFSTIKLPGIGSALGSMIGGVIGNNFAKLSISTYIFKSTVQLNQAERFLTLLGLASKSQNYTYQYHSFGYYNNWVNIPNNGTKQRPIYDSAYLDSQKVNVNGVYINNLYKESSVYLNVNDNDEAILLPPTTVKDRSRFILSEASNQVQVKCFSWFEDKNTAPFELRIYYANGETIIVSNLNYFDENGNEITHNPYYCECLSFEFLQGAGAIDITITEDTSPKKCVCNTVFDSTISSYYGSIKTSNKNQYKTVYDIKWLEIGSCIKRIPDISNNLITIGDISVECATNSCEDIYFGGDTFIGNFSFKRKHHFWLGTNFNLPDYTDIYYSDLANIAYPTYFYNTQYVQQNVWMPSVSYPFSIGSTTDAKNKYFGNIISGWKTESSVLGLLNPRNFLKPANYYLDCSSKELSYFNFSNVDGKQYNYYFGISNIIVESDINLDLRYAKNTLEQDFYPHQSDLNFWLQEKNVSPKEDNYYHYNRTYSKQQSEGANFLNDINFRGNEDVKINFPNRVIYSSQSNEIDNNDVRDNFLINKALDYHDFSLTNGELNLIKEIEGNKVLAGFENQLQVFNAYLEINTNADTALISAGSLFKQKPVEFSKSEVPYIGTQHDLVKSTPFGHVIINAKTGNVFLVKQNAQGIEEISNKGVKHWFKNNLPFEILNISSQINIDNNFENIGLSIGFDKRFDMLYITKLDFKPKKEVTYLNGKFYYNNIEVSLKDKTYFEDISWTIGYSFLTESWISWYSFKPLFYVDFITNYYTGIKGSIWKHNVEGHYQSFYGKTNPFIIELKTKYELEYKLLQSCKYYLEVLEYKNKNKHYIQNIGFNKAIIYNKFQNTGLLELEFKNENVISNKNPEHKLDRTILNYTKKENQYTFSGFVNKSLGGFQWLFDGNNVTKKLNKNNLNFLNRINNSYIRGDINFVRLISDNTNYHFIFKGLIDNSIVSKR